MNFVRRLHGAAVVARQPLIKFPQRHSVEGKPLAPIIEIPAKPKSPLERIESQPSQHKTQLKPLAGKTVVLSSSYGRRPPSQEEMLAINMGGNR